MVFVNLRVLFSRIFIFFLFLNICNYKCLKIDLFGISNLVNIKFNCVYMIIE